MIETAPDKALGLTGDCEATICLVAARARPRQHSTFLREFVRR